MFIFIGCAGGSTSSMFCQRMVKEINSHDENLTAVFDDVTHVLEKRLAYGSHYDLVFAYGGIGDIRPYNAYEFGQIFDAVLLAPQVSYLKPQTAALLAKYPTMLQDIPGKLFGMMDGEKGYDLLLDLLIDLDLRRGYLSGAVVGDKGTDKDLEIYVAGAGSRDPYWKNMLQYLENQGLRCVTTPFSLEKLYDFEPQADFDVRFVFGRLSSLTDKDFARVARRIDAFVVNAGSMGALKNRRDWLRDYQIPYLRFDDSNIKKDLKNGKFAEEEIRFWNFLERIQAQTEYTTEISVEKFEKQALAKRKTSFFGLLSWE